MLDKGLRILNDSGRKYIGEDVKHNLCKGNSHKV